MIRKGGGGPGDAEPRRKRRRAKDPLNVKLSVRFNFGTEPEDHVMVIDQRSMPMVGGIIANRDRLMRGFVRLLLRTAFRQPRIARQVFPRVSPQTPPGPRRKDMT